MIQGVHAETIAFSSYADACEIALTPGWPWLGDAGLQGSREVNLGGVPARRVRLRVSAAQAHGHSTRCSIELLEVDRLFTPRIQLELTLQPNDSGTRLTVSGLFARDLVFFFNDTATTEIYTLSLHDALPISVQPAGRDAGDFGTAVGHHRLAGGRSEEHTSELESHVNLVCRLLLEKKKS